MNGTRDRACRPANPSFRIHHFALIIRVFCDMDKHAIALVLAEIGTLLELQGESRFKASAFLMAARVVEKLDRDLGALVRAGRVESIRGVGPATARVIRELVETGTSQYYLDLRSRTPDGLRELLAVPGLGARRVRELHEKLGVTSVEELERAAAEGRIAGLRGFGKRMQDKLVLGAGFIRGATGRRRTSQALEPAHRVVGYLRSLPATERVELAGEMRRWLETVSGVEVVASVSGDGLESLIRDFTAMPGIDDVRRDGGVVTGRFADGFVIRLACVPPLEFATNWLLRTGSETHLAELHDHGTVRPGRGSVESEAEIYEAFGLPWIAPELREGRGEVGAAAAGELPALIEAEQLKGCFHCHTTYSDGRSTIAQLAEAAGERGWRYIGIADHSQAASYAGGLTLDAITRQHDEIDGWNDARGDEVRVLKGIEADILTDGRLDYAEHGDRVLGSFEYVIGSVHSAFGMPRDEMTKRVLRALENPHLSMLGHPTGRLLLTRDAYALDVEAVLDAAARRGVAVEINADPFRMDLDWRWWCPTSRNVHRAGTPASPRADRPRAAINPDAHSVRALDNVFLGTMMARKGWLSADDVVNAWDLDAVLSFFGAGK